MKFSWTENVRATRGQGMTITYGYTDVAPYGRALAAMTDKGLCFLGFPQKGAELTAEAKMKAYFPKARFEKGDVRLNDHVDMYGTPYQIKIWKKLVDVRAGETLSYGELAQRMGMPRAARAVGSAMAANPVCLYVPCHRVITSGGGTQNYAWGADLKNKILRAEAA